MAGKPAELTSDAWLGVGVKYWGFRDQRRRIRSVPPTFAEGHVQAQRAGCGREDCG